MDYTITNVQKRDEWEFKGNRMQDYAITLEGETNKGWIKLTQKVESQPPTVGQQLYGHVEKKATRNGTEYWKFKKEQRDGGGFRGESGNGGGGTGVAKEDVEYIIMMLEELTLRRPSPDNPKPRGDGRTAPVEDTKYDDPFEGLL